MNLYPAFLLPFSIVLLLGLFRLKKENNFSGVLLGVSLGIVIPISILIYILLKTGDAPIGPAAALIYSPPITVPLSVFGYWLGTKCSIKKALLLSLAVLLSFVSLSLLCSYIFV